MKGYCFQKKALIVTATKSTQLIIAAKAIVSPEGGLSAFAVFLVVMSIRKESLKV